MIVGPRLTLRTLEPSDASLEYAAWLNDPVVNQYLETRQATIEDLQKYIQAKLESSNTLFFGIFWIENNRHIGNVKLEPIDFDKGVATMGILIGDKEYWGRGVATEVTNLIVDFAFSTLGLAEVNLGVLSENKAAIRVYEKCGFVVDRIDSKSMNHGGVLYDQVYMRKIRSMKSEIRNNT